MNLESWNFVYIMDDKLLYHGIDNQAHCYYYFLYTSIFCLFRVNLCHSVLRNYEREKSSTSVERVIVAWD